MIQSELIDIFAARNPHLYHQDVEKVFDTILDEITSALERGDRAELRGFGAFFVRHRPARSGRNPKSDKVVFVEEKWVPFFRAGKEIKERVNDVGKPAVKDVRTGR